VEQYFVVSSFLVHKLRYRLNKWNCSRVFLVRLALGPHLR
jgi:hypothetical protein